MSSLQEEKLDSIASVALVSDEGQTNERELLLKTLLSEKASEASLKRTFTAAGEERDNAFAEFKKAQYKHSVLHSKHKQIQSELEKKSIMVKLIQDAYSKAGSESDLVVGTNSKCCGEGEVVKNGEEVVPNTHYEMKETVNEDLEFADKSTDEELLDLLKETEKNLSKDGIAAVGGQTTSATKEKQNEEHTGKKNGPTVQANEKHFSEAVALPADVSPAKKKRLILQENEKHSSEEEHSGKKNGLTAQANEKHSCEVVAVAVPDDKSPADKQCLIVQENEKHSSEAAALPGVMGRARNRKEKENQSSEGASLPAVVSPPRNPPKKKNVSI